MKNYMIFIIVVLTAGITFSVIAETPMEPAETNISFKNNEGITLRGYLSLPEGPGPFPGILLIHEWWGLNKDTAALADEFSREGYAVLAADTFRGSVAQTRDEALKQVTGTPQEQIKSDLDSAFHFLASHGKVKPGSIAVVGFCFGGTQSMHMGTRNPDLAAVVIFYGGNPITDAANLGTMKQAAPVLGIYGREDQNIPVSAVKAFADALDSQNIENNIFIFSGVGHAFVKSTTFTEGKARSAWNTMLYFLEKNI